MATFEDVWKGVLLHAPMASPFLARKWVQWAYTRAGELRPWSDLRVETEIVTTAQKTGTVTLTNGSTAVTGGTLALAASDLYRQIRVDSAPIYTLAAINAPNGTLDRAYTGPTGSVTAFVLDAYVLAPADFARWDAVVDLENAWRLRHWQTEQWLDHVDPKREHSGAPRCLVSRVTSPIAAILGRVTYELWPYVTDAKRMPTRYIKVPATLADTDTLRGPLGRRADILETGALSQCAKWPGVEGRKNPYFSLALSTDLRAEFDKEVGRLEVQDEDIYPTWTPMSEFRFAPLIGDANWLRVHDAPAGTYY